MANLQIRWKRHRQRLKVLELDRYPSTPAGYYSGYYPGSGEVLPLKIRYSYARQKLQELNVYPTAEGVPPSAYADHFEPTKDTTNTKLQEVQELNQYTATPAAYYEGHYPGSKLAEGQKQGSKVKRQELPELNSYPATPQTAPITATDTHFEKTRNLTNRVRQDVELDQYTQTDPDYYEGYYPGTKVAEILRNRFKRKLQTAELNEYPQSAVTLPAVVIPRAKKLRKTRYTLRSPEQLSVFAPPPDTTAPDLYAIWDVEIEITPNFGLLLDVNPKFNSKIELKPNFDGKFNG